MGIKLHHVRYAFAQTAWILVLFGALIAWIAITERRSFEDLLWASVPGVIIWFGFFMYWIWRTQKSRSDKPRPGEWS